MIVREPAIVVRVDYERILPGDKPSGHPLTANILATDGDDAVRYLTTRLGKINVTAIGTIAKLDAIADRSLVSLFRQMTEKPGAPEKKKKQDPPDVKKDIKTEDVKMEKRKPGRPPVVQKQQMKNESIPIDPSQFGSEKDILKHIEELADNQ
jgi:hypothetical protein